MRVKISLAYDGSRYLGFQVQSQTSQTVAGALYEALGALHIESKIVASGRTDKDVHATRQIIHIDLPPYWSDLKKLKQQINHKLPASIRIKTVQSVPNEFHARYSALKRSYCYIISTKDISVFQSSYLHYEPFIDMPLIQEALKLFYGTHDFEYFQKTGGGTKSSIRTIFSARIYAYHEFYILRFTANGFLRSQIRMMVEMLLRVNNGTLSIYQIKEQLEKRKKHSFKLANPAGLYLTNITY